MKKQRHERLNNASSMAVKTKGTSWQGEGGAPPSNTPPRIQIGDFFSSKIITLIILLLCLNVITNGYDNFKSERIETWESYKEYSPTLPSIENVIGIFQLDENVEKVQNSLQNWAIEGDWGIFEFLRTFLNSIVGIVKLLGNALIGLYQIATNILKLLFV